MAIRSRLRNWWRRIRRKRAAKREAAPLREFVYLDEVSVYSLIASKLGAIATEFTETETTSLQTDLSSSVGGGVGLVKGEISSRTEASRVQGSQVLRKSIVQTTFKELYELEQPRFAMRCIPAGDQPPAITRLDELERTVQANGTLDGWVIDPAELSRGRVVELEVELETESVYRVTAVLSSILEIVQEDLKVFGVDNYADLAQAGAVNRAIQKLLVGLIPVRGRAIDYDAVEIESKEWLVHKRLLESMTDQLQGRRQPLHLVGVAQESLFWKDIRRVLFADAPFRVLGRVSRPGLNSSWTPVKLVDVLKEVIPDFGAQVDMIGRGALAAMGTAAAEFDEVEERARKSMRSALTGYALDLAERYGKTLSEEDLARALLPSDEDAGSFGSLKERREAFGKLTRYVEQEFEVEVDPLVAAQLRAGVLLDAGLDLQGRPINRATSDLAAGSRPDERYLDAEFIAIYW